MENRRKSGIFSAYKREKVWCGSCVCMIVFELQFFSIEDYLLCTHHGPIYCWLNQKIFFWFHCFASHSNQTMHQYEIHWMTFWKSSTHQTSHIWYTCMDTSKIRRNNKEHRAKKKQTNKTMYRMKWKTMHRNNIGKKSRPQPL